MDLIRRVYYTTHRARPPIDRRCVVCACYAALCTCVTLLHTDTHIYQPTTFDDDKDSRDGMCVCVYVLYVAIYRSERETFILG